MRPQKTAFQVWLQLLRAPNLFTVPGDPLAGFLLASGGRVDGRLALAILASLCFYAGGLLLNDLADLDEDRRERPTRPLPSGAADGRVVWGVAGALAVLALLFCLAISGSVLVGGCALLASIAIYNLWSKKIAIIGALNMCLCRGLSLVLGATAGLSTPSIALPTLPLLAAIGLTLYIAIVTNLARIETRADPPLLPRQLPFIGLILTIVPFFLVAFDRAQPFSPTNLGLYAVSAYTLFAGWKIHRLLGREPAPPIPPMIGQFIRLLLPLQAIWCVASHSLAGGISAVVLLMLWPISRQVSRRFYAS